VNIYSSNENKMKLSLLPPLFVKQTTRKELQQCVLFSVPTSHSHFTISLYAPLKSFTFDPLGTERFSQIL
jgi:hypothetical protein